MNTEMILGVTAGLMHIIAFVIYYKQMLVGTSRPNTSTWTLWVFISTMNCLSYIVMSKSIVKGLLPIASTTACIMVFFASLFKGKLSKLNIGDEIVLVIGVFSLFVWWAYHSAIYANLLLQICIIISFVPTYRGIWKDFSIEKAWPWFVWSSAYILQIILVFLKWEIWYQLVYPVNCLILHAGIGMLALSKFRSVLLRELEY